MNQPYTEHTISYQGHQLYAREYPGTGPAIVLLHGFPDNLHLYDYLIPFLRGRHIITFDFLGWGASDKPAEYPYTATNQIAEIDAVVNYLKLAQVVLVCHDASGPPAIDWALQHPERTAGLVLLNTYYSWTPALRAPLAIGLYSTPVVRNLARLLTRPEQPFKRLFMWQVGRFMRDADRRQVMLQRLYPELWKSRRAFWALNNDLLGTVWARRRNAPQLKAFTRPVQIIFGAADTNLNPRVARRLHALLPSSQLHLLPTARHYVQVDEPQRVAGLILAGLHG